MTLTERVPLTEQEQQTLQVIAQEIGVTQTELLQQAVQLLIAEFQKPDAKLVKRKQRQLNETAKQRARQRFERHFGMLNLDYLTSVDNEQIDADLAQAYAMTNEN